MKPEDFDGMIGSLIDSVGAKPLAGGDTTGEATTPDPVAEPPEASEPPAANAKPEEPPDEPATDAEPPTKTPEEITKSWRKLQKREAKLAKLEADFSKRLETFKANEASLTADIKALMDGDLDTKDSILRRRAGGLDAVKYFDFLSQKVIPGSTGEKDDLRRELAELKRLIVEDKERAARSEAQRSEEQARANEFGGMLQESVEDADEYPALAEWAGQHPQGLSGVVQELFRVAQREAADGRIPKNPDREFFPMVVAHVARTVDRWLGTEAGKQYLSGGEPPNGKAKAETSPTAPARGKLPGTSVSPRSVTQPINADRDLTPEERAQYRERLIPGALKELGLLA